MHEKQIKSFDDVMLEEAEIGKTSAVSLPLLSTDPFGKTMYT